MYGKSDESAINSPFTRFAFAVAVLLSEEVLSVHAGDLFARGNVSEDLDASPVPSVGNKLQRNRNNCLTYVHFEADNDLSRAFKVIAVRSILKCHV